MNFFARFAAFAVKRVFSVQSSVKSVYKGFNHGDSQGTHNTDMAFSKSLDNPAVLERE
jgi:hypothetical protein